MRSKNSVSESNNSIVNNNMVVVASLQKKFKLSKKYMIILLGTVLILVIGFIILFFTKTNNKLPLNDVCTKYNSGLLNQAQASIADNNYPQLLKVVNRIKSLPGYTKDPNCLYPLVYYYVNIGDVKNSNISLAYLEKVYKPKQGFSKLFTNPLTIKQLNADVSSLDFNAQHLNILLINQPITANKTK